MSAVLSSLEDGKGRKQEYARRPDQTWPHRKPTLASVDVWEVVYDGAEDYRENDVRVLRAFSPNMEFYRVEQGGRNVKSFYGEMAWADATRLASDLSGSFVQF